MWIRKPVSIRCDHHLPHAAQHIVLIVACGMLSQSSSMAVQSCWILVGTGKRCRTRQPRASQTCSMVDMSGEYVGGKKVDTFGIQELCALSSCIIILKHEVNGSRWMAQQWASGSHLPSARCSWNRHLSMKSTLLQHSSGRRRWAFAHCSKVKTPVRMTSMQISIPETFLTVCAEII